MFKMIFPLGTYPYGGVNRVTNRWNFDKIPVQDGEYCITVIGTFDLLTVLSSGELSWIFGNQSVVKHFDYFKDDSKLFDFFTQNFFWGNTLYVNGSYAEGTVPITLKIWQQMKAL